MSRERRFDVGGLCIKEDFVFDDGVCDEGWKCKGKSDVLTMNKTTFIT